MRVFLNIFLLIAAVSCTYALKACPAIYAPVCGFDGNTYSNKCFMEANNVELHYPGSCISKDKRDVNDDDCPEYSKNGICTMEYSPVCASNGQTYANKCGMCAEMYKKRKEGEDVTLAVVHQGSCDSINYCLPRDKSGICTREYMPICGSDGTTYGNRCEFCYHKYQKEDNGEDLSMEYFGQCLKCPAMSKWEACPKIYKPVCGNDGKTYDNLCALCAEMYIQFHQDVLGLTLKHERAC